jgi:hypothetical protein
VGSSIPEPAGLKAVGCLDTLWSKMWVSPGRSNVTDTITRSTGDAMGTIVVVINREANERWVLCDEQRNGPLVDRVGGVGEVE